MANYSLLITPTYTPRSFEEMVAPYKMYGEYYDSLETALSTLEGGLADMEKLKNVKGSESLYNEYKTFADQLNVYSEALASGNLKGLRSKVRTAAKDYVKQIKPIEDAYNRMLEIKKAEAEAKIKNPSILNSASDNIMTYYNDPLYSWAPITGDYLRTTMGALAQTYQNEYSGYNYDGPNIVNHFGLNADIITKLANEAFYGQPALGLSEKERAKYLPLINNMEQLKTQYGYDGMSNLQQEQFANYVIQGLNAGIGQDRVAQRPTVSGGGGGGGGDKPLLGMPNILNLPISQDSKTKDVENNYSEALQNQELVNANYNKYLSFFQYGDTGTEKNKSSINKEVNNAIPWLKNLSKEGMGNLIDVVANDWGNFKNNGLTVQGRNGKPLKITANMLQVSGLANADKLRLLDEATDWSEGSLSVPMYGTISPRVAVDVSENSGLSGSNYASVYKDIMNRTGTFNAPVPTKRELQKANEAAQKAITTAKSDYPAFSNEYIPAALQATEALSARSSQLVSYPIKDDNSAQEIVSTFKQKAGFNNLTKPTSYWSDVPAEEIVSYNFKTKQYHPVSAAELEGIDDVGITMSPDGKMYFYMANGEKEGRYYIQKTDATSKGADDYTRILNYFTNLKLSPEGDSLSTDVLNIQRQVDGDIINVIVNNQPYKVPISQYPEFVDQMMEKVRLSSFFSNPELISKYPELANQMYSINTNFLSM